MGNNVSTDVLMPSSTTVLPVLGTLIRMTKPKPSAFFAANLQKVLTHQGRATNAAAVAWRVPQKTLESYLKQTRVPSIDTAHAVAEAAGYHLWQMLQEHFDPANPPVMQPVSPEEKRFHEELRALMDRHRVQSF